MNDESLMSMLGDPGEPEESKPKPNPMNEISKAASDAASKEVQDFICQQPGLIGSHVQAALNTETAELRKENERIMEAMQATANATISELQENAETDRISCQHDRELFNEKFLQIAEAILPGQDGPCDLAASAQAIRAVADQMAKALERFQPTFAFALNLHEIGWKSPCDAQWQRLDAYLEFVRDALAAYQAKPQPEAKP